MKICSWCQKSIGKRKQKKQADALAKIATIEQSLAD
jgi:hypothetical protein